MTMGNVATLLVSAAAIVCAQLVPACSSDSTPDPQNGGGQAGSTTDAGIGGTGGSQSTGGAAGKAGSGGIGGSAGASGASGADAGTPAPTDEVMGYAAMNGGTTGGAGGPTVTVTSCSELNAAVQGDTPKIVKVSGTIVGNDALVGVGSNTSIIGLPGAELRACGLYMFGTHNVIIQNLKLVDGPTYSPWTAKDGAHHIWVDHVEMRPEPGVKDSGHTMGAVTNGSDYVTVSWSSMYDKYTGLLIGSSPQLTSDTGHLTVTVHHCLFDNMLERQPKVRFGTVHAFNNYFRNAMTDGHTPYGITVTMGGTVRTDANYFENFEGYPISTRYDPPNETDGFISGLETNYKDAVGSFLITTPASSWMPPYSYAKYLTPVMDVPAAVLAGVGPTL